jgi:GxxExxY protein
VNTDRARLDDLSELIIGRAFVVSNELGPGFLEKVYENALAHELRKAGLAVQQQVPANVHHDGVLVGTYVADLMIENALLVEIKAVKALDAVHSAQCMSYLRASGLWLCLLINFGNPRVEVKRLVSGPLPQRRTAR